MNKDYSHYSLESLKTWIHDAMESDAEPEEVYEAISAEIDSQIKYHTQKLHYANKLKTICLLYTSPSPRDATLSRMPSSA